MIVDLITKFNESHNKEDAEDVNNNCYSKQWGQNAYFGFGSYKVEDGKQAIEAIKYALTLGYRHIDTASFYDNEALIAQAIKESGIPREEIFITSKIWNDEQGYESTLKAFEQSIQR